jgi:hypothetical protein
MMEIFKLAEKLYMEDCKFTIYHDAKESPSIVIKTDEWYEVATTVDETLLITRFDTPIFEHKEASIIFEVLMFNIKRDIKSRTK